jgi:hypothetical protein
MSTGPTRQRLRTRATAPCPLGSENAEAASTERQTLLALARLLGRQAARDFTLQQQETDGSISKPPVDDV